MTLLVVDASVVLSWCFEDEASPESDALIDRVAHDGAAVPGLWSLEIANALVVAERRRRIEPADSAAFVALLEALPFDVDTETSARAWRETMALARLHGLSVYDASYLELAARRGAELATADNALRQAAKRAGVTVIA